MYPGRYPSFVLPFSLKEERAPLFRTSEGSKTLPGRHLPFALPLSLREENHASAQETGRRRHRRGEDEKEKENEKAAKRQITMPPGRYHLLTLLFPLKKERGPLSARQRGEDPLDANLFLSFFFP